MENKKEIEYFENLICDWNVSMCGEVDCQCDDCKCAEEHIEYLKRAIAALKRQGKEQCLYCKQLKKLTLHSPRNKYKYCPMCGKKLEKNDN